MASKRKKKNSKDYAVNNGVNMNNGSEKSKNAAKKKQQQQQFMNKKDYRLRLQEILFSPEHILKKIFRKDGPPLGVEFDSLPSPAFQCCEGDYSESHRACHENQRASKRQKVSALASDGQVGGDKGAPTKKHGIGKGLMTQSGALVKKHGMGKGLITKEGAPVKKHGIGKGLMTIWRIMNPDGCDFPSSITASRSTKVGVQEKKKRLQQRQTLLSKLRKRSQEKRKSSIRNRKFQVGTQKIGAQSQPRGEKCELALQGVRSQEDVNQFTNLIDDEELELRELQAGPNPLTCSAHLATNGLHGCSLCKDLLGKFPPDSVSMKLPLYMQPWDSSPELVKKLFKVFHFLCTYAMIINISSFTLDQFAQAFHDKDSLLLGQVHVALIRLLLSDIEKELSSQYFPHASKNSKFLELLRSVEHKKFVLESWQKALNALTWTEILRQVLVAAGFGSKLGMLRRDALNKEANLMASYGLSSGTLKGELFSILLNQGSNGMKVSELAKLPSITELNVAPTTHELECLVSSTLSSDITLFEKISSCGYRLRANPATKEPEICQSDSEDFGSVDDESEMRQEHTSSDESDELGDSHSNQCRRSKTRENKYNTSALDTEIDESHPGEAWLLGLMEGEYSDLSIEEKLRALLALIDLLNSGYSIRLEDPVAVVSTFTPNISQHCSGAKIKRSMQYQLPGQAGCCNGLALNNKDARSTSVLNPADSFVLLSKISEREKSSSMTEVAKEMKAAEDLHPMQSIFLGSDRRYNRYWLFLGPCSRLDPGHKRIYFESSEDGHWELIEREAALCSLLSALDQRGAREAFLLSSLEKRETYLCQMMSNRSSDSGITQLTRSDQSEQNISREDSSSAVSDVDNNRYLIEMQNELASTDARISEISRKAEQQRDKWNRAQAFDRWVWESFYSELNAVKHGKRSYLDSLTRCEHCHDLYWRDEKHCKVCHTTFELDFDLEERYAIHAATCRRNMDGDKFPKHKVLSSQLQSLKAAVHAIESVMPNEVLMGAWAKSAHNLWVKRLRRASTLTEFMQVIADFVFAINEEYFYQFDDSLASNWVLEEILASFPTMPQTSSAIALWLVKLDALVAPHLGRVQSQNNLEIIRRIEGQPASHR